MLFPLIARACCYALVILCVWFSVHRVGDSGRNVCGDHHRDVLLSAL